jgi:dTDP-4-dehydrorhamnose reductase
MKILILGSNGMLGQMVYKYFSSKYDVEVYNKRFTIENRRVFLEEIKGFGDCIIINCIGVLIEGSNQNPGNAIFLNAYLPHKLLVIANKVGAKLINISTDCVFSGNNKKPYSENDEKDGVGIYATTKSLGEIADEDHLILRTSVVGPELKSDGEELFHWFMLQTNEIFGFTKVLWSGVTTIELAKAIHWSIEFDIKGLYHVTNNSSISKYELLKLFNKYTKKNINILTQGGKHIDKSFVDTRKLINYEIPSYDQMISEMIEMILKNKDLYSQYKLGGKF